MPMTTAYRFANAIWVEEAIGKSLTFKSLSKAALFSITPWLVGLVISSTIGRASAYLATPSFYVGSAGIFLTTVGLVFGSSRQYSIYDRLLSAFEINPTKRRGHVLSALGRHSNFWHHVRAAAIIFAAGLAATIASVFFWDHVQDYALGIGTYLPRLKALELHGWYDENVRWTTVSILLVFLAFISATLGTSASIILRMPLFLWRVSDEPPRLPPALIKLHFTPAATFYSVTSLLWLGGVGLLLYFFGLNGDWASYGVVLIAFLFGMLNLAIPQVAYLRTVAASEERYLEILSARFGPHADEQGEGAGTLPWVTDDRADDVSTGSLIHLIKHNGWVYPVHETYAVMGSYAVSLAGTVVGWDRLTAFLAERFG